MTPGSSIPVLMTSPTWQMNGVNVFSHNLAAGLSARGVEVAVILTDPHRTEPLAMERPDDLTIEPLDVARGAPLRVRWAALRRRLLANRPCIYIPNYDWHTSVICFGLPPDVGVIGVVHADDPRHYEHFTRLGRTWNATVAVSQHVGSRLADLAIVEEHRLHTIPIGVRVPPPRRDSERPSASLRILYVGLLKQFQKRVLEVPGILRTALDRGVDLDMTFAGGGDDELELRARCAAAGLSDRVRFLGILGHDELIEEMNHNDVLLMVSEFEGLPNALLEAMACSLVPVVPDISSGIPEVVRNGHNGIVVDPQDWIGFAEAIQILAAQPDLRTRLGSSARRTIETGQFRVEHMVSSYLEVITWVRGEIDLGTFRRRRRLYRLPPDLPPLWRHYVPRGAGLLWRRLRRRPTAPAGR